MHNQFSPSIDESITERVVDKLAEHNDVDPTALEPPLHDAIDTDALNALFATTKRGPRSGRVSFTYRGRTVTVEADDSVSVEGCSEASAGRE